MRLGRRIFYLQNQAAEGEVTLVEGTLVEGEVYAVLYDDGEWWYRGLVESVINSEKVREIFSEQTGFQHRPSLSQASKQVVNKFTNC